MAAGHIGNQHDLTGKVLLSLFMVSSLIPHSSFSANHPAEVVPQVAGVGVPQGLSIREIVETLRKNRPSVLKEKLSNLTESERANLIIGLRSALASEKSKIEELSKKIDAGTYNNRVKLAVFGSAMVVVEAVLTIMSLKKAAAVPRLEVSQATEAEGPTEGRALVPGEVQDGQTETTGAKSWRGIGSRAAQGIQNFAAKSARTARNIWEYYSQLASDLVEKPGETIRGGGRSLGLHSAAAASWVLVMGTGIALQNLPDDDGLQLATDRDEDMRMSLKLMSLIQAVALALDSADLDWNLQMGDFVSRF
ncbi:MAG: hypothetical protein C5B49_12240 [Bdellovibrio sp.]|nr:MAG: hypothetical protein C5B49_12240 [Bdellovibrio sp.]